VKRRCFFANTSAFPVLVPVKDRRAAARLVRNAFRWRIPPLGRAYAWWTVTFRAHWTSRSANVVLGMRTPSITVRLRARLEGVRLPSRGVIVFDLASTRRREHVFEVVDVVRAVLRSADQEALPIMARIRSTNLRLERTYHRLGLRPLHSSRADSRRFVWLCRPPETPHGK